MAAYPALLKLDCPRRIHVRSLGTVGGQLRVALAAAGVVCLLALHPGHLLEVFPRYTFVYQHLPGRAYDGPDPIWRHVGFRTPPHVNTPAIRQGGKIVPDDAVYYVKTAVSNRTSENIPVAAQLFFLPAVRSQRPQVADWILSYRVRRPSGVLRREYILDRDLRLTRVR